jgi:DNA-binding LacI/PurR family transcriptional regulator
VAQITIQDIARLAGVSSATVSRAMHSPRMVSQDTLENIQRVIRENKYIYNATAADLSRKKSSVVCVLIPTTGGTVFAGTVGAIEEYAYEHGLPLMVGNTRYDPNIEATLLRKCLERRVAGVVLTGYCQANEEFILSLAQKGLPCLVAWEILPHDLPLSYVGIDNFQAAFEATDHLLSLGHARVGLIVGPRSGILRARRRYDGYVAALEARNIACDPAYIIEKSPSLLNGKEAMSRLLRLPKLPTAVFAASDFLAIGALAAVREAGLRTPQDISIVGFDDIEFTNYCSPPLSTVHVPSKEIGHTAISLLMELKSSGDGVPRRLRMDTHLVLRGSCKSLDPCASLES